MNTLITLAEAWWPLYATHMIEVSLFILLVWAVDRWLTLETRLRYALYLLALAKVFMPPVLSIPIPAFLVFSTDVTVDAPVYSGVISGAIAVAPVEVAALPPAFYLFCLWILSVLACTAVALWKNTAFRHMLKSATPVDLASKVELRSGGRNLKVYSKASLPSPTLVGVVTPRLYLPSTWSSWSPDELRGVVRHELAHFERRDIYVLILQAIATALFGVNPLIWLMNRRLMYLRELRCDETVLRETNLTAAEYGRLLLGFVDRRAAPSALSVYFSERETRLKRRLEHILNYKEGEMKRSKWQLVVVLIVGLMVVPFSIREAYTQDDGGTQVSKSAADGKKAEITQEHKTAPPAAGNTDTVTVGFPTYDESEVETKPVPIRRAKGSVIGDIIAQFVNSDTAPEAGFTATVTLKVRVDVDGSVGGVKVLSAEGPVAFKNAAVDAVSRKRFKPAKLDGEFVPVWFTQRISVQAYDTSMSLQTADSTTPPVTGLADVLEIDQVETKPHPVRIAAPDFPKAAGEEKLEGVVTLRFIVNVDNSVSDVTVLKGPEIFHKAATDAALQWRFRPAKHRGEVVPTWVKMPMAFTLKPEEKGRDSPVNTTGHSIIETPEPTSAPPPDKSDVEGDKVFEFWSVDAKPVVMHSVQPNYPDVAQRKGLTGSVFLKVKVNVDGSVSDVHVLKGDEVFRKPAIEAVTQLRYKPAELDGKPVPVWMIQHFTFAPPEHQDDTGPDTSDPGVGN